MNRADCYKLIYELETNDKSREAVEIHDNDRYDHLIPIYDALGKNTSVEV